MAYENYDVSALPEYVNQDGAPIVRDAILGGKLAQRVRIQQGVKGKAAINILDADPTIQAGACGFNPTGTDTLTQRTIETAHLSVQDQICVDNFKSTYAEYLVRIPEVDRNDLPFEEYYLRSLGAKIRNKTELLLWQGDSTGVDPLLSLYDGLLAIADADLDAGNKISISSTDVYGGLLECVGNFTEEMIAKGAEMYISPVNFMKLTQELVNLNLYHFPVEPAEEIFLPGHNIKVVSMYGLKGLDVVFCTYPDNLVYGTDDINAEDIVASRYDKFGRTFDIRIDWNAGINFAFPEDVIVGTWGSTPVIAAPAVNALNAIADNTASLSTISTNVAELADADHVYKTKEQA